MSIENKTEPTSCARCGLDFRGGAEHVTLYGTAYCKKCAEQLQAQKYTKADTDRFADFMAGKAILIPLAGTYAAWNLSIEVEKATGAFWLVRSRSVGGRGASFGSTTVEVFVEEPKRLTAEEVRTLAARYVPGAGEIFTGLTDTNGAEYIGRYTEWCEEERSFSGCGPMAKTLQADFKKLGIRLKDTLARYGAPLSFGCAEKTGIYFVQEPAERNPGIITLFRDRDPEKFRWFLLEYVIRRWAEVEEDRRRNELIAAWKRAVPYKRLIVVKELTLQKLSLVFPPESPQMQVYANDILNSLNGRKPDVVHWMLDPDTMTFYMPSEKHHTVRDLEAEQSKLEAQLQSESTPGYAYIRRRLDEIKLESLFIDTGPDMAVQLMHDMITLELKYENVRYSLPSKFGHGSAGYWADDIEYDRDHGREFVYPVCREAGAEEFRWIILERAVRHTTGWASLHRAVKFSLRIRRLCKIYERREQPKYEIVPDPRLEAYIEEKIASLHKSHPDYDWAYDKRSRWITGTPKAGTDAPPYFPPTTAKTLDATTLPLYGDPSGHGDQISVGRITSGEHAGLYYWTVSNDGYPDRMSGGGFSLLLPEGLVKNGCVRQQTLFCWIRDEWPYASYLRDDPKDQVVLDLDNCKKLYPDDVRVSPEGLRWVIDNSVAMILGCEGAPTELTIPEQLGGIHAIAIAADAFCDLPLKQITLPNNIYRIGSHAIGYDRISLPDGSVHYRPAETPPAIRARVWSAGKRYAEQNSLPFEEYPPAPQKPAPATNKRQPVQDTAYNENDWQPSSSTQKPEKPASDTKTHRPVPPKRPKKSLSDWGVIAMTCFYAVMAVIFLSLQAWLGGITFSCLVLLMIIAPMLDRRNKKKSAGRKNTKYNRKK